MINSINNVFKAYFKRLPNPQDYRTINLKINRKTKLIDVYKDKTIIGNIRSKLK